MTAAPLGASDPCGARWRWPRSMSLRLSRCWCPTGVGRTARPSTDRRCPASQARKESNPLPPVLEAAAPPWLEPRSMDEIPHVERRTGGERVVRSPGTDVRRWTERSRLPTRDGQAGLGLRPSTSIDPRVRGSIELARRRAEARQGEPLELQFGGVVACHVSTLARASLRGQRIIQRSSFGSSNSADAALRNRTNYAGLSS